jgi:carbonic anhydrase
VPPEIVFDAGLGDIFVVRVAGNVASAEVYGSLQYAGAHLGTPLFLVLGHDDCGAVKASIETLLHGAQHGSHIQALVDAVVPGLAGLDLALRHDDVVAQAVEANVRWTMHQIEQTPEASAGLARGRMAVVGAVYELQSGRVRFLP